MNHRPSTAAAALLLAAGLTACSAPKAAPASPQLTTIAEQLCSDLAKMSYSKAVNRMAVRASESDLSSSEQDAVIDLAAKRCPDDLP